jgi:hypothetical protein
MRLSLEDCDVEKDITAFIKDLGTGQEIPDPPKFINFCRGDAETSSQASDDENYSVAQFARTMNPSYRASSPQPSMFESHHDPNNPLAKELGLQQDTQPIARDEIDDVPPSPIQQIQQIQQEHISVAPRQSALLAQDHISVQDHAPVASRRAAAPPQEQISVSSRRTAPPPQDHNDVSSRHSRAPSQDHMNIASRHSAAPPQERMQTASRQSGAPPQEHMHVATRQSGGPSHEPLSFSSRHSGAPQQDHMNVSSRHSAAPQQDQINVMSRHVVAPLQHSQPAQTQRTIQPDPRLIQAQQQARQHQQQSQVPHNDYPADGMTQYCRAGAPSDRSTIPSPIRPSSRDSQSEYSNPTSFSSIEPPSGSASPGKPMPQSPFPEPSPVEETSMQKKRGFFNSPFGRRKSKHEREPPTITPSARNTWAPATRRTTDENVSPTRPFGRERNVIQDAPRSASPEPVDPRANFQLNVGNNVFDVASPDKKRQSKQPEPEEDLDPIAQALEELKGVTKQTSLRVSADRYHGLATPQPPPTPAIGSSLPGGAPTPLANVAINAAKRGTPPPSYEQPPMSRLGAPKPAHTARQMQKTTQMYVNQKASVFNGGSDNRSSSRSPTKQEPPRAPSPAPARAPSPRPVLQTQQSQQQPSPAAYRAAQQQPASPTTYRPQQQQQQQQPPRQQPQQQPPPQQRPAPQQRPSQQAPAPQQRPVQQPPAPKNSYRSASPNPQAAASNAGARPRAQTATAPAQAYGTPVGRNSHTSTRGASPSVNAMPRAASPQPPPQPTYTQPPPQPAYAQPQQPQSRPASRAAPVSRAVSPQPAFRQSYDRPASSHSSKMALSIAAPSERGDGSVYGGSVRGRGNNNNARPQSSYYGGSGASEFGGGAASVRAESRARSKSLAEPKQYNRDGRIILNYCKLKTRHLPKDKS